MCIEWNVAYITDKKSRFPFGFDYFNGHMKIFISYISYTYLYSIYNIILLESIMAVSAIYYISNICLAI